MPKHYAKKHLTRIDPILDQINNENDDTTTDDSKAPSHNGARGQADADSSTT